MEVKMEKDNESMVVKPVEYAASEYSSTSEAPPAYKMRQANSVKIAKIVAFTVILSSFILGSFLLASTYLQAKVSCDQVSALDAILDKELMLETMQQDLPRPEALLSQVAKENILQDLSKDEMNKPNLKDEANIDEVENINDNTEDEETNSIDANVKRVHVKLPLEFDLSELAHNILMNNQKSRMNCVVERRLTEEVEEPKQMNPFLAILKESKKEKVTGERLSIFCESGEPKIEQDPMIQVRRIIMPFPMGPQMHSFGPQFQPPMNGLMNGPMNGPMGENMNGPMNGFMNGPMNGPMGEHMNRPMNGPMNGQFPPMNMPQRFPLQFAPPQGNGPMNFQAPPQGNNPMNFQAPPQGNGPMNFQAPPQTNFQVPQLRGPFTRFQQQMPPIPAQMISPPRPEVPQFRLINPAPQQHQLPNFERPQQEENQQSEQPELRVHLRRIQIPGPVGDIFPFLNNIHEEAAKDLNTPRENVQIQQMPLAVALSKVGITPEDLKNIQRMAEEKFQEHIREFVGEEESSSTSESDSHQSGEESDNAGQDSLEQQKLEDFIKKVQSGEQQPQILSLGRSNFGRSLNPVQLPGNNAEIQEAERADFVHPR